MTAVSAVGQSTAEAVGSSVASSTAVATGQTPLIAAVGGSAGVSVVSGVGSAIASAVGTAAGSSTSVGAGVASIAFATPHAIIRVPQEPRVIRVETQITRIVVT
jgi:hypothetical protein